MATRFHFLQDSFYFLVGADEVGRSFSSQIFFPVHAFLHPDMICLDDFLVRIAQQGKWKTMLLDEFLVTFRTVDAHAEELRFGLEFAPGIAKFASLRRAPRSAVL